MHSASMIFVSPEGARLWGAIGMPILGRRGLFEVGEVRKQGLVGAPLQLLPAHLAQHLQHAVWVPAVIFHSIWEHDHHKSLGTGPQGPAR